MKYNQNLLILAFCCVHIASGLNELKLGYLLPWTRLKHLAKFYAGAVTRVIDDINNNNGLLNETKVTFLHSDTGCGYNGARGTIDLYDKNVSVFIGPVCSKQCLAGAEIAAFKEIPMISFGCSAMELSNKTKYPYFSRAKAYARSRWAPKVFVEIMKAFKWKHACIIDRYHDIYAPLGVKTLEIFMVNNLTIGERYTYGNFITSNERRNIILKMSKKCRGMKYSLAPPK